MFLKKLKIQLPYDPEIPLLVGIKKLEIKIPKRYLHPNDLCSQDVETNAHQKMNG
jgi:hypothetical protein